MEKFLKAELFDGVKQWRKMCSKSSIKTVDQYVKLAQSYK